MRRSFLILAAVTPLLWEAAAAQVAAAQVPAAAVERAAIARRDARDISVDGRRFHIKATSWLATRENGRRVIRGAGELSHVLRFRPDDQYRYEFTIVDGRLSELRETIDRGGVTQILTTPGSALNALGVPLVGTTANALIDTINRLGRQALRPGPGWVDTARRIVAALVIRIAAER